MSDLKIKVIQQSVVISKISKLSAGPKHCLIQVTPEQGWCGEYRHLGSVIVIRSYAEEPVGQASRIVLQPDNPPGSSWSISPKKNFTGTGLLISLIALDFANAETLYSRDD